MSISVNFHPVVIRPSWQFASATGLHFGGEGSVCTSTHRFLFIFQGLWFVHVGFETRIEVVCGDACVCDGEEDQDDGEDGEGGKFLSRGQIWVFPAGGVHADHFEDKVRKATEVEDLRENSWLATITAVIRSFSLTITMIVPANHSLRTNSAAAKRIMMVTGMAAMVSANSARRWVTMTTNWTVNPRKKKKSNLRTVI